MMPTRFKLPTGRIVSGSPTFVQTKDYYGKPKEKPSVFFAVAVPKQDCNAPLGSLFQEAVGYYHNDPRIMPQIQAGLAGKFAWKVEDGDKPENAAKEGYAGCYVFKFSTTLGIPACYDRDNRPMDPALIKRGYYVEVYVTASPNELHDQNAGLFLNPDGVRFVCFGQEIASGPSAEEMFGATPPPVPAGGSLTPLGQSSQAGGNVFSAVQSGAIGPQAQAQPQAMGFQHQPQSHQPQAGFPGAATGPTAQAQQHQAAAASGVAGSQMGTAFPGSPAVFPGT